MPSAPPKLGGGAKSKNQLRRMKAKAKKIADQGIDKSNDTSAENGVDVKAEEDVPVSSRAADCKLAGLAVLIHDRFPPSDACFLFRLGGHTIHAV